MCGVLVVLQLHYVYQRNVPTFNGEPICDRSFPTFYGEPICNRSFPTFNGEPICDRSYSGLGITYFDVVPRRAYYDNRSINGEYCNILFVMAEVNDASVNSILACELNECLSNNVRVLKEDTDWVREHHPIHTHGVLLVQCLGFPMSSILNGSIVKLIYKNKNDSCVSRVETEKTLILKNSTHQSLPTRGKGSIVVCTAMYDHPPLFDEWLKYQKAIGIDMVHLNVHSSFAKNATSVYPFLGEALKSGFVYMEEWEDFIGDRVFYYSQVMKYQDCGMRYIGVFEYGLFCDYDDFFNPMHPHHKNIKYYLKKFFSDINVGTLLFRWRQFQCKIDEAKVKDQVDGNMTKALSGYDSFYDQPSKCVHRLSALVLVHIHNSQILLPGYTRRYCDNDIAYMAHSKLPYRKMC